MLADLSAMLRDFYYNEVPEKGRSPDGSGLSAGPGVTVTAATSSPRTHVTRALERLGLLPYFRAIYTTGELGVSKHRPDIYHLAAQGVPPRQCLVAEDPSMPCKPPLRQATAPWAFSMPTARRISRVCGIRRRYTSPPWPGSPAHWERLNNEN